MTRPVREEEPRTPSGQRIVPLPETNNRTAYRLTEFGKTFVGNRNSNTEVYLNITPNGRVEIKVKRDGAFFADYYIRAE